MTSKEKNVTFKQIEKNQVLVGGANPQRNTYYLRTKLNSQSLHGLRLEAIPHESMPGGGVGREEDRNQATFGINDFSVEVIHKDGKVKKLKIANGNTASSSISKFELNRAFDEGKKKLNTAWLIDKMVTKVMRLISFLMRPIKQKKVMNSRLKFNRIWVK